MTNDIVAIPTFNNPVIRIFESMDIIYELNHKRTFKNRAGQDYSQTDYFTYTVNFDGRNFQYKSSHFPKIDVRKYMKNYIKEKIYWRIYPELPSEQCGVFIKRDNTETFNIRYNIKNYRNVRVVVHYTLIEEQIIALLTAHQCSDEILMNDLRVMFTRGNCESLKEYVDKKSKYLSDLDLKDYVEQLNEDTEKRRCDRNEKK